MKALCKNLHVWIVGLVAGFACHGAGADSIYLSLPQDVLIQPGSDTTLLSTQIAGNKWVYLQTDGRYFPWSAANLVNVYITVDGVKQSNDSLTDWRSSTNVQQHAFNAIGAVYLGSGTHTVALLAGTTPGSSVVGAASNLIVMTNPASNVWTSIISPDTGIINISNPSGGISDGTPVPVLSIASINQTTDGTPVVVVGSGRSYSGYFYGDALWNLSADSIGQQSSTATYSNADLFTGAEPQAPMFVQGVFSGLSAGPHTLSLDASKYPYAGNPVQYAVGAGSRLIALNGGMSVFGGLVVNYLSDTRANWLCIGGSSTTSGCNALGTPQVVANTTVTIPQGHNGVVLFSAKTRMQGDSTDSGGYVVLSLEIDGMSVGSYGVQGLASPNGASERTISASYLAAGANALTPGIHTVTVVGLAQGSFLHMVMSLDLPLIYFD